MRAAGEPLPGVSTRGSNRNCGSDEASKALSSDSSQGPSFQGMQSGCTAGSTHKVNSSLSSSNNNGRLCVLGCGSVPDERFDGRCALCLWTGGILLPCAAVGCNNKLHPICCRLFACGQDLWSQSKIQQAGRASLALLCAEHQPVNGDGNGLGREAPQDALRLHPVTQLWRLLQRSGDALQTALDCQRERSVWAARISAMLLQEVHETLKAVERLWLRLHSLC
ncbi:hypothetical protein cyc_05505 [Cyclospora cayetanensis]|uniref:Uncharacterized protein n=1 Tax=Cyclospora cayetanensis TaxID=88456 RepID=A0A1D3D7W6_9EIME|nr:hypothetical protein cyc_05505 [Cyclospora cayetanensis]